MATTCWATANPELAAKRFRDHQRHNKALWSKRYTTHRVIDQPLDDIPDQAEMRVLDRQFGKWGEKLWCGLAVPELVDAIEGQWEQPQELRGFFALAHAANNETQHTTVRSLMTPVLANSSDVLRVDAGPSLQFVQQALYASLWIYAHMLRATAYHFEIDGREKVMPLFARLRTPCEPIPAEDVKRAGRNDPCPCGSSKKFKHCHGR